MFFYKLCRFVAAAVIAAPTLLSVGCASKPTVQQQPGPGRVVAETWVPEQPSLRSARVEIDRDQFQGPVKDLQDQVIVWTYLHEGDPRATLHTDSLEYQLWEAECAMVVLHHWHIADLMIGLQRGEVFYSEEFDTIKSWARSLHKANDARARRLGHAHPRELMLQLRVRGLHIPYQWESLARKMPVPDTSQNVAADSIMGLAAALSVLAETPPIESSGAYWRTQVQSYQHLALVLRFQHLHEVSPQPGEPPYPTTRNRIARAMGYCARMLTTHLGQEINPLLMERLAEEHSVDSFEKMRGNAVQDHQAAFDTALWVHLGDGDDANFTPDNVNRIALKHFHWIREVIPAECKHPTGVDFEPLREQARAIFREAQALAAKTEAKTEPQ